MHREQAELIVRKLLDFNESEDDAVLWQSSKRAPDVAAFITQIEGGRMSTIIDITFYGMKFLDVRKIFIEKGELYTLPNGVKRIAPFACTGFELPDGSKVSIRECDTATKRSNR